MFHNLNHSIFLENISDVVDYAVEVEVFGGGTQDFMQEMMSPTFIVLASCVAFATLVVILLTALICNKLCRSKAQNNGYTIANGQVRERKTSQANLIFICYLIWLNYLKYLLSYFFMFSRIPGLILINFHRMLLTITPELS